MADTTHAIPQSNAKNEPGFVRAIGLFDGTMIVVGSMIGSGIFIVAADISRQTGSAGGLLLTWIFTGLLTDRKSTRLNSSHGYISYAVFCLKKKKKKIKRIVNKEIKEEAT